MFQNYIHIHWMLDNSGPGNFNFFIIFVAASIFSLFIPVKGCLINKSKRLNGRPFDNQDNDSFFFKENFLRFMYMYLTIVSLNSVIYVTL